MISEECKVYAYYFILAPFHTLLPVGSIYVKFWFYDQKSELKLQNDCVRGGVLEFPFVAGRFTHRLPSLCHHHVREHSVHNQEIFLLSRSIFMWQDAALVPDKGQQMCDADIGTWGWQHL